MGIRAMKRLKIGYWPISSTLDAAGDRRRLIYWASARGHSIVTDLNQSVDVIVASENSDFNSFLFSKSKAPVIFDLVDAYLSPSSPYDDFARGLAKKFSHQISGGIKPFSHHVRDFCLSSSAVICSSIEQESVIRSYNTNTHVILDSHEEIPFINATKHLISTTQTRRILWEGQPATIRGVKNISHALLELAKENLLGLDFVTDEKYYRLLNKYFERNTLSLLKKDLGHAFNLARIIPWSPNNLVEAAKASEVAIIPIDLSVPMQKLKPENRLLIMWRLGLPCLTSPSPAFLRVSRQAGVSAVCNTPDDWWENLDRRLRDPEYAWNEIQAGQNYLRENHNESILLSKWDTAIESVLG